MIWPRDSPLAIALHCNYTRPHERTALRVGRTERAAANVKKHGVSFEEAKSASTMNAPNLLKTRPFRRRRSFCPAWPEFCAKALGRLPLLSRRRRVIRFISARKATAKMNCYP